MMRKAISVAVASLVMVGVSAVYAQDKSRAEVKARPVQPGSPVMQPPKNPRPRAKSPTAVHALKSRRLGTSRVARHLPKPPRRLESP